MTDIARTITFQAIANTNLKEEVEVPDGLTILGDGESAPESHCVFRIISQDKGDERLTWSSRSLAEIQAAKELFVKLIKKGLKPFKVGVDGAATSKVMDEFDPTAEEVIFLPQALVCGG
jgi:hypothetical protein